VHERQRPGPFQSAHPLVLASGSPRRREILAGLGLDFHVAANTTGEPAPDPGEAPADYVRRSARVKAAGVARLRKDCFTLGADTIVVVDGEVLGKPRGAGDALDVLLRLSGRSHDVITGCCLQSPAFGEIKEFFVRTRVWFGSYPQDVLRAYVATGEPMDKAGSYAIQGVGAFLVERIEGSYTNVVGLPVHEVLGMLLAVGAVKPRPCPFLPPGFPPVPG